MFLAKDNVKLGLVLGLIAPVVGLLIFKFYKFTVFSFKEVFQYMLNEPGFRTLTVALSLSLLMNALLFTIYVNTDKDKTAKGIFITTLVYAVIILLFKAFY